MILCATFVKSLIKTKVVIIFNNKNDAFFFKKAESEI